MNKIEKFVYNFVKHNPKIKGLLRNIYQLVHLLKPHKKIDSKYEVKCFEGYFFGFHDKVPYSSNDKYLLVHKYKKSNSKKYDGVVEIGYLDLSNNYKYIKISNTHLWNWQQGSMLQWINNDIIFNDIDDEGRHIAKIYNVNGILLSKLKVSIGAISKKGNLALSYDFDRLKYGMEGYEYSLMSDGQNVNCCAPKDTGLYLYDINTNEKKLLFSIYEITQIEYDSSMEKAYHFFTHCLFNEDGSRFLFLHRWKVKGKRLYSRLISCDINGGNVHIFKTNYMVSHFTWIQNTHVMAYCEVQGEDGYYIFEDKSEKINSVDKELFNVDGHPQYCNSNNLVVTDTYPDKNRIQALYTYETSKKIKIEIGKFYSPFKYREKYRCDLHPRWNNAGNKICFDSVHTGRRSICIIDLNDSNYSANVLTNLESDI